jgi:hypothetical protein
MANWLQAMVEAVAGLTWPGATLSAGLMALTLAGMLISADRRIILALFPLQTLWTAGLAQPFLPPHLTLAWLLPALFTTLILLLTGHQHGWHLQHTPVPPLRIRLIFSLALVAALALTGVGIGLAWPALPPPLAVALLLLLCCGGWMAIALRDPFCAGVGGLLVPAALWLAAAWRGVAAEVGGPLGTAVLLLALATAWLTARNSQKAA